MNAPLSKAATPDIFPDGWGPGPEPPLRFLDTPQSLPLRFWGATDLGVAVETVAVASLANAPLTTDEAVLMVVLQRQGYQVARQVAMVRTPLATCRQIDLFAVRRSDGRRLAFELKATRSDLVAELRKPEKRAPFEAVTHAFYFVLTWQPNGPAKHPPHANVIEEIQQRAPGCGILSTEYWRSVNELLRPVERPEPALLPARFNSSYTPEFDAACAAVSPPGDREPVAPAKPMRRRVRQLAGRRLAEPASAGRKPADYLDGYPRADQPPADNHAIMRRFPCADAAARWLRRYALPPSEVSIIEGPAWGSVEVWTTPALLGVSSLAWNDALDRLDLGHLFTQRGLGAADIYPEEWVGTVAPPSAPDPTPAANLIV